jgi:hypothetical protein
MTKEELFEMFDRYDAYETLETGETVQLIYWHDLKHIAEELVKNCSIPNVLKSLPNDEEVKAHIDTLPYYGTCTTEYNEGFEDGVKWLKEQIEK